MAAKRTLEVSARIAEPARPLPVIVANLMLQRRFLVTDRVSICKEHGTPARRSEHHPPP